MGILYNRFTPEPSLLPFSNQSKIITYATSDNFVAGSSTWGDGTAPIRDVMGTGSGWYKNTSDDTVAIDVNRAEVTNTTALGDAFTIYEVLCLRNFTESQVNPYFNTYIYRGNQQLGAVNDGLFVASYSSGRQYFYYSNIGQTWVYYTYCNLPRLNKLHITVAAYENLRDSKHVSTTLRCNAATVSASHDYTSVHYGDHIESIRFMGNSSAGSERYYKFIAIVSGKESNTVISNNTAFLKTLYGIEY